MKYRKDFTKYIVQLEHQYPVDDWTINGIHIWPFVRVRLFFCLIRNFEKPIREVQVSRLHKKPTLFQRLQKKLIKIYDRKMSVLHYKRFMNSLPQRKYVFVGSESHRVNHEGKRYNRFFDTLIEQKELKNDSLILEYGPSQSHNNYYNGENVIQFNKAIKGFRNFFETPALDSDLLHIDSFITEIKDLQLESPFDFLDSRERIEHWAKEFLLPNVAFFKEILLRVKPSSIYLLYYYSMEVMTLVIASRSMNIKTIEMQHGPQADSHIAYGSWTKVPKNGYAAIPKNFWCWDQMSRDNILKWAKSVDYHASVRGNPWIDYWNKKKDHIGHDIILMSLQPQPVDFKNLFTPQMIKFINSTNHKVYVRLHPRQASEQEEIYTFFRENNLVEKIETIKATSLPLPLLLRNTIIHITQYSGCTIEAHLMNVKTITMHPTGVDFFKSLMNAGIVKYMEPNSSNLISKLNDMLNNQKENYV